MSAVYQNPSAFHPLTLPRSLRSLDPESRISFPLYSADKQKRSSSQVRTKHFFSPFTPFLCLAYRLIRVEGWRDVTGIATGRTRRCARRSSRFDGAASGKMRVRKMEGWAMDDCSKRKEVMRVHPIRGQQSGSVSSFLSTFSLSHSHFHSTFKTLLRAARQQLSKAFTSLPLLFAIESVLLLIASFAFSTPPQSPRSSSAKNAQAADPHRYTQHGHHVPNISLPPRAQSRTQRRAPLRRHARLGHPVRPAQQGTQHHITSFLPPPHSPTSRLLIALTPL